MLVSRRPEPSPFVEAVHVGEGSFAFEVCKTALLFAGLLAVVPNTIFARTFGGLTGAAASEVTT